MESVTPGYAGGTTPNPTYENVCSGTTGHAEVIEIVYDPSRITYRDLLTVFFATHDATSLNRQGNDVGTQYRSVILTTTESQKQEAETFVREINTSNAAGNAIVTDITPLDTFYPAEDDHRDYYAKNQDNPYCQVVINPKLEKVKEKFRKLLKEND